LPPGFGLGYSGPWPVFAAFPPLAKSDYFKRNEMARKIFHLKLFFPEFILPKTSGHPGQFAFKRERPGWRGLAGF